MFKTMYLLESGTTSSGEGLNEEVDIVWDGDLVDRGMGGMFIL